MWIAKHMCFLLAVFIYLTWPHHPLTVLLYLYMCASKCQLFTDGCRLPKRLNYYFSVLASATDRSIWVCLATQIYILCSDIRDVEHYTTMDTGDRKGLGLLACHHMSHASLFDLGVSPLILLNEKHVPNTRTQSGEDYALVLPVNLAPLGQH